jgi:protein ImuB
MLFAGCGGEAGRGKAQGWFPLTSHAIGQEQVVQEILQLQDEWFWIGEQYSPSVGWDDRQQPTCMFVDITKTATHWGDEVRLLREVLQLLYRRGYLVEAAIGPTVGSVWAAVHYGRRLAREWLVGERDHGRAPTRCLTLFQQNQIQYLLVPQLPMGRFPVQALRLSKGILELLRQLGLDMVGQLQALPRDALRARFGELLLWRLDQLTGKVEEALEQFQPAPRWEVRRAFEHPLASQEVIEQAALDLLRQLCEQLLQQQRGVIQLEVDWDCGATGKAMLRMGTYRATAEFAHLGHLLQMHLMSQRLPGPLHAITLSSTSTAPLRAQQELLFEEMRDEQPKALAQMLDVLSCRLGGDRVVGVQLLAEPQIERSFRYVSLTGKARQTLPRQPSPAALRHHTRGIGQRPCRLLAPPVKLETIDPNPKSAGSTPPTQFRYQGTIYHVTQWWGPERLETGWWRGPTVRRDYYRVEDDEGRRFWLYQNLRNGLWFMHADSI